MHTSVRFSPSWPLFAPYYRTVETSKAINLGIAERPRPGPAEAAGRAPVMRVPFTLDDLALARFRDAPSPLCESLVTAVLRWLIAASGRPVRWRRRGDPQYSPASGFRGR